MTTRPITQRPAHGTSTRQPVLTAAVRILLVALTATLISGCRAHIQVRGPRVRPRAHVSVTATHVHGAACGHVWTSGRWAVVRVGHHHHSSCGHFFYENRWHAQARTTIKVGPVAVTIKQGHRHSNNCGHFHHNGKWFLLRNHVHGLGCGHRLRGSIWIKF